MAIQLGAPRWALWGVFSLAVASLPAPAQNLPTQIESLLGKTWVGSECCGWTWTWQRKSGVFFRGEFRNPNGERLNEDNITVSIRGDQVEIVRGAGSAGGGCTYNGNIRVGFAGGTYACAGRPAGSWSAKINAH